MPTTHEIEEQEFGQGPRLWDADPDVCCAAFQLGACAHTEGADYDFHDAIEMCGHTDERVTRVAHGFLGDAPAGTVQTLCSGCGMTEEEIEVQRAENYYGPDFGDFEQPYPEWTEESGRCWTTSDEEPF